MLRLRFYQFSIPDLKTDLSNRQEEFALKQFQEKNVRVEYHK